ncbi:MAG: Transposase IS4 family protein [Candidatus Nomurabacteria bacterium GW2011_GWA1_46_11]|uniref:Transposase IS4 family protein n=1 Tax=Candidatus Nomurabacteria bacterium GW2011_GWA1_46_11 TaxID=1618732 RepID=A0A0G1QUP5_9BACT|nr:MAG: Transposase IS4 family protein [Microgenomates group bacterium GW2011_GWA2_44_7]KKT77377.1 MAG: Transposase IS4 family protein [Microgenomates group bacterium GW2011_GWB1_44_8]KKU21538.1 MAG: Transposase IS4 family protein [Candidatus Nomurabacteria bacterium GW2011_GWA1_46_11]
MVTKKQYIEYLVHTPVNYTCSNLANHLDGVSHDAVSDFLLRNKATSKQVWELGKSVIENRPEGYLILDDSVQDKNYSREIEMVKKQYSGTTHSLVRGIGVVNLVHYHPASGFNPVDYRVYAPMQDGKTKQNHAQEMVTLARSDKGIKAATLLMDSFYASATNLKLFHRMGLIFFSQLKSNRLVSLTKEGGYIHMADLDWNEESLKYGLSVKLRELPFRLQLFKVVAPNGDIDWVVTNHPERLASGVVQKENELRWKIEEMHRELKELTGIESCQARKSRAQRNHISYCYQTWFSLKRRARELKITAYALHTGLYSEYLKKVLKQPIVPAYCLGS